MSFDWLNTANLSWKSGFFYCAFSCLSLSCILRKVAVSLQRLRKRNTRPPFCFVILQTEIWFNNNGIDKINKPSIVTFQITKFVKLSICQLENKKVESRSFLSYPFTLERSCLKTCMTLLPCCCLWTGVPVGFSYFGVWTTHPTLLRCLTS